MGDGTWLLYEDGGLEDDTNNEEPLETKIRNARRQVIENCIKKNNRCEPAQGSLI